MSVFNWQADLFNSLLFTTFHWSPLIFLSPYYLSLSVVLLSLSLYIHFILLTTVTRCWSKKLPNFLQKLPKKYKSEFNVKSTILHNSPKMFAKYLGHFCSQELSKWPNLVTLLLTCTHKKPALTHKGNILSLSLSNTSHHLQPHFSPLGTFCSSLFSISYKYVLYDLLIITPLSKCSTWEYDRKPFLLT